MFFLWGVSCFNRGVEMADCEEKPTTIDIEEEFDEITEEGKWWKCYAVLSFVFVRM